MNRRNLQRSFMALLTAALLTVTPMQAAAQARVIVRVDALTLVSGLTLVKSACSLLGCTVLYGLDGSLGKLFLVATSGDGALLASLIPSLPGIASAEVDGLAHTRATAGAEPPPALLDDAPVSFYGATVRHGYVSQPAVDVIRLDDARARYGLTGSGVTVAVIDTGVDPNHPVLAGVLTSGYDFTRNISGGSEKGDVSQSTVAVVDGVEPAWVNQSTVAVVDQSTVAVVDDNAHAAFGHGTMVAGVVHLVAPKARIMPLKAFNADGSGYTSDVLRAIYYAVQNKAKVLNMSFSFDTDSAEVGRAVAYAQGRNVITVASSGNDGLRKLVYPAADGGVVGVASSSDYDVLSDFSNFGPDVAFVAAPGEGIVTTYPFGTYAAAWGTSFSAPFAAGTAALLAQLQSSITNAQAADAEGYAKWISSEVRKGRLDVYNAIRARAGR